MKRSKSLISKFHIILILSFMSILVLASSVYSFSTGGGIYGECDTEGTGECQNIYDFRFASGLCVTEEDWTGNDEE